VADYPASPYPTDRHEADQPDARYPGGTSYAPDPYPSPFGGDSFGNDSFGADPFRSEPRLEFDSPAPEPTSGYPIAPTSGFPGDRPAGNPGLPGGRPAGNPAFPGGQSAGNPGFPGGLPDQPAHEPEPSGGRAGRNLPAAIGVGVALAGVALGSLFFWRPAFLAVLAVAVGVGIWELVRAIRSKGANPPLIPLIAGGSLMTGLAWWGHADALTFGLMVTVLAAMVWRLADGAGGYGRDVIAATLVAVYVPFLVGFAALLATSADGDLRVLVTLAGVVLSDTGGYIAGVLFGRHPMAPSVSPKKSWEGLAGSLVAAAVGGAVLLYFLFQVPPWLGAVFGLAVSVAAVVGDLGESMIKRDLGVKDMSQLLPGHGGVMDRLDSIVLAAPTAYVLLLLLAPPL
jgi:phosphatidate cytidylyltransferase